MISESGKTRIVRQNKWLYIPQIRSKSYEGWIDIGGPMPKGDALRACLVFEPKIQASFCRCMERIENLSDEESEKIKETATQGEQGLALQLREDGMWHNLAYPVSMATAEFLDGLLPPNALTRIRLYPDEIPF